MSEQHTQSLPAHIQMELDGWVAEFNDLKAFKETATATIAELQRQLEQEREKVKGLHEITKVICTHCCEPMEIPSKAVLQTQLTQLKALVRALPAPEEGGFPIVEVDGDYYVNHTSRFSTKAEADAYTGLLTYRATLDATTPAQTDEQRCIEACCERPHDCKWGGTGGCGYEGRKPKGGDGE